MLSRILFYYCFSLQTFVMSSDSKQDKLLFAETDISWHHNVKSKYLAFCGNKIGQEFYVKKKNEALFDVVTSGKLHEGIIQNDNGFFKVIYIDGTSIMISQYVDKTCYTLGVLKLSSKDKKDTDEKGSRPRFADSDGISDIKGVKTVKSKYRAFCMNHRNVSQEFYVVESTELIFDLIFSNEIQKAIIKNDNGTFMISGTFGAEKGKIGEAMISDVISKYAEGIITKV